MEIRGQILEQLKKEMRNQDMTYDKLGKEIERLTSTKCSTSTVKRFFRSKERMDMSLSRLESICEVLGMDIFKLIAKTEAVHRATLTIEQEKKLVEDPKLLLMAYRIHFKTPLKDVLSAYEITKADGERYLKKLVDMGIVERLSEDQICSKLPRNISYHPDGHVAQFINDYVIPEFVDTDFKKPDYRLMEFGMMSPKTINKFHKKMKALIREFQLYCETDERKYQDVSKGTTLMVAIRNWTIENFEATQDFNRILHGNSRARKKRNKKL